MLWLLYQVSVSGQNESWTNFYYFANSIRVAIVKVRSNICFTQHLALHHLRQALDCFCDFFNRNWPCFPEKKILIPKWYKKIYKSLNINVCTVTVVCLQPVIGIDIGMTAIIFYHCNNICFSNPYLCQQSVGTYINLQGFERGEMNLGREVIKRK